jgi:DNA repair exonuclease SbcCD ATPase subunit
MFVIMLRTRLAVTGLLVGLLATGATPANAQWTVYDPAQYALQTERRIEEASRWIEKVRHHVEKYQMMINQWVTLKDVLTNAEKLVGHNLRWASTIASIGKSIRGIYTLQDQIENLVTLKIRAFRNIYSRLRNGIFDPGADLQDLEEYLRHGLGRSSAARIATLDRLANLDPVLQTAYERLSMACAKRAALENERDCLRGEHAEAVARGDAPSAIEHVEAKINDVEQQIVEVQREIDRWWIEMTERAKKYHAHLEARHAAALSVWADEQAWESFFSIKEAVINEIEDYDRAHRDTRPRWVDPPTSEPILTGN